MRYFRLKSCKYDTFTFRFRKGNVRKSPVIWYCIQRIVLWRYSKFYSIRYKSTLSNNAPSALPTPVLNRGFIEEGRAASISFSQQVVSVDITKNSAVAIFEWWILEWTYLQYSKRIWKMCQRGNCPVNNLKIWKVYKLIAFLKTLPRLKQEWQKSPALRPGK